MKTGTPSSDEAEQLIAALRAEVGELKEQLEQLRQVNQVLRLKVDAMARKLFGKSSEKLDPAQLQMVFDALNNVPDEAAKKTPPPVRPPATRRLRRRPRRRQPNAGSARWSRSLMACR